MLFSDIYAYLGWRYSISPSSVVTTRPPGPSPPAEPRQPRNRSLIE